MKNRGHPPIYFPKTDSVAGQFYNHLINDGEVDGKLLAKVLESCDTIIKKVKFLNAILLQPPTGQQHEWIHAYGMAWIQSDNTLRYDYPERVPFVRQIGDRAVENLIDELD